MMSVDPVDYVVTPKALAMIAGDAAALRAVHRLRLFGGYLVGVRLHGRRRRHLHVEPARSAVDFRDDMLGSLLKACLRRAGRPDRDLSRLHQRADLGRRERGHHRDGGGRLGEHPHLRLRHHRALGSVSMSRSPVPRPAGRPLRPRRARRRSPTCRFSVGGALATAAARRAHALRRLRRDRRPQAARARGHRGRQGRPGRADRRSDDDYRARVDARPRAGAQAADRHVGVDPDRGPARRPLHLAPARRRRADCSSPGDKITFTESAVILERLIGKFMSDVAGGPPVVTAAAVAEAKRKRRILNEWRMWRSRPVTGGSCCILALALASPVLAEEPPPHPGPRPDAAPAARGARSAARLAVGECDPWQVL